MIREDARQCEEYKGPNRCWYISQSSRRESEEITHLIADRTLGNQRDQSRLSQAVMDRSASSRL
jgi:hypothetical protein